MIVCLCKGVTERDITNAARCGARTLNDVARHCDGAGTDCGSCRRDVASILTAARRPKAA